MSELTIETLLRAKALLDDADVPTRHRILCLPQMTADILKKLWAREDWYAFWRDWRMFRRCAEQGWL